MNQETKNGIYLKQIGKNLIRARRCGPQGTVKMFPDL